MLSHLQEKHDAMISLYRTHRETALELQTTLRDEILPLLREELELDEACSQLAREWIDDCGSIFRMYKKHSFNRAETSAALERTLRWRISDLNCFQNNHEQVPAQVSDSFIQCLPNSVRDVFGRPVLLIRMAKLLDASDLTKQAILCVHERLRQRLCVDKQEQGSVPTLQCVMIVDFKDVAMRSMDVEIVSWFIRELAPRFPGMCAAVFVVNYGWAYGMYSIVKRLLPANVLARIYFPSQTELLSCFESHRLPQDYGGDLDKCPSPEPTTASLNILAAPSTSPTQAELPAKIPPRATGLSHFLPSMSMVNPYFGYPAISRPGSSVPHLKNGRRRKRDLARTLALMWFAKLKRLTDKTWMWIIMTLVLWALELRSGE